MSMRRLTLLLIMVTGTFVAGVRDSDACTCVERSPCQLYASADAVFLGDVIDVQTDAHEKLVRMRVSRTWKGQVAADVTVSAEAGTSANCSIDVGPGQRRVIYASIAGGQLSTSLCQGGWALEPGAPDPVLPPRGGQITGRLARIRRPFVSRDDLWSYLGGARVWVDAPSGRIASTTDADGRFTLNAVPPGRHAVRFDVGPAEEAQETVDLRSPEDCASVFATTRPSGRLTGRLVSEAGEPQESVLHAIPTTHDWSRRDLTDTREATTDETGAFTFVGLEPGRYVIGVNAFRVPRVDSPYRPVYYPGVAARDAATVIDVAVGPTAPLDTFVLRDALPRTTLTAEIVCRDGTRPARASLEARMIAEHNHFGEYGGDVVNGRLVLPVLRGFQYEVKGSVRVRVKSSRLEDAGISWQSTAPLIVDTTTAPPVIRLESSLEKCDAPGGPLMEW